MSIEVNNETEAEVDEAEFAALARYVLDAMRVHPQSELSILFVDTDVMSCLLYTSRTSTAGPVAVALLAERLGRWGVAGTRGLASGA